MRKRFLSLLIAIMFIFSLSVTLKVDASDEYVPSYSVFKIDTMESLDVPENDAQQTRDYVWGYTNLFWVETNNVNETTDPSKVLSGNKSLTWAPGAGDSEGWTASNVGIGISPSKMAGSSGGYLIKLELLVKLENVHLLVIKAFDSNNVVRQEMILKGDYTNGSDDSTNDKDSETKVEIEKITEANKEYAKVSFTIRSSATLTTYYTFTTKSANENALVVLDDVTVLKENDPVIPHRNYEEYLVESFDVSSVDQTIFTGTGENLKSSEINSENPIMGTSDIKLTPSARNKNVTLRSAAIKLDENYYKLYYKFRGEYVVKAGIYIKNAETNDIIYDLIINPNTNERLAETVNPLFDASNFYYDSSNIYTAYGEFEVDASQEVYVELYYTVSNVRGYISFDDVNILKQYTPVYPETYPSNDPEKVEGVWDAVYKDLDGAFTSFVKNSVGNNSLVDNIYLGLFITCLLMLIATITVCKVKKVKLSKNKVSMLLAFLLVIFSLSITTSCVRKDNNLGKVDEDYTIVSPEKLDGKLDNPGQGWVMLEEPTYGGHVDIGSSGEFPEIDNVSLSTSWAAIEYEEGVFDWSTCDQTIEYWTGLGKRVNLRICTDNLVLTYTYKGCPDWLFDKYNVNYVYVDYTDPGPVQVCRVVDVRDKTYLKYLDRFLDAMYEHYKDNPMVDTVEIRGFGTWGEWHHGWNFVSKDERMATLDNILNYWYQSFKDSGKLLCVCSSWDPDFTTTNEYYTAAMGDKDGAYQNYVNWSSFDTAWRMPGVTFRRDSGGALMRYDLDERIMAEAFRSGKRLPLLGEYATSYYVLTTPNNAFNLMSGINDILYKMRPNYSTALGWVAVEIANYVAKGETEFVDRANKMMGYRLSVDTAYIPKTISKDKTIEIMTTWSNSAVGIFPYKTDLNYHLLDSNNNVIATIKDSTFDARLFNQGEINNFYSELSLPSYVDNGTYKLAVSMDYLDGKIALGMAGESQEDSRMYVLSEVQVVDSSNVKPLSEALSLQKTTYDKIGEVEFDANSTYEITFRYLPGFDMSNFYFGTGDHYEFSLVSDSAKESDVTKKVGTYRWQDISGEIGYKTVVVTTGNHKDYKMNVKSYNFDEIAIDEVWIRKVKGVSENFEEYDVLDASTIIEPINITSAESADSSIEGRGLSLSSSNLNKQHILAKIDTHNYQFLKGVTYTITFDFRAIGQVGNGGYFFIASGEYSKVNRDFEVIGEWYERDDNWDTKKSFTFTPMEDGLTIAFGVNASGSYHIDNLIISSQETSQVIEGEDFGYEHNVIPTWNVGMGIVETFEAASFQGSGFEWGQFAWGRMTSKENEVVNPSEENKTSLLCRVEAEAYNPTTDNVWFEFVRSKLNYYKFEANAYYKVTFEYKILKEFSSGKVFCFFRDDTLADRFAKAVNAPYMMTDNDADLTTGKEAGVTYTYTQAFKIGDHGSYQFMMCANGLWEFAVDNILIEKITEEEARQINGITE